MNPFCDLPYEISGPIKHITNYLNDIKFLWCLSMSCKDCYALFWLRELYYKMLVQKCRRLPHVLKNLISKHYLLHNTLINNVFITDVVKGNGKAILFIPFQLGNTTDHETTPLINIELMNLALKQYPKIYERINGLHSSFQSDKYNHFIVQHEYLHKQREFILHTEVRSCLNTNVYHMDNVLSCFCANCQYNRIIERQNRYPFDKRNVNILPFASNYYLAMTAVSRRGHLLFETPMHIRTKELVLLAAQNNGDILRVIKRFWNRQDMHRFFNFHVDQDFMETICITAVKNKAKSFRFVPEQFKTDELMYIAIMSKENMSSYLTRDFIMSVEKMLNCIRKNPNTFRYADYTLRDNLDFVEKAIKLIKIHTGKKVDILKYCGNTVKSNRKIVFSIIKLNPREYWLMPKNMAKNISIYNYVMKHFSKGYRFSPYTDDFIVTREAVVRDGNNLLYASLELMNNKYMIKLALQSPNLSKSLRESYTKKLESIN